MSTTTATTTSKVEPTKATRRQIELLNQLVDAERALAEREAEVEAIREKLTTSIGLGHIIVADGIGRFAVTNSTTYGIDLDSFVALRPRVAARFTKKVLNVARFGQAVRNGELPADVLPLVTEKVTNPTLRPTWAS